MTEVEKRKLLTDHCTSTRCDRCKLKNGNWENATHNLGCLNIELATEEELDRAIGLIHGMIATPQPEARLEQIEEDADTVIKIKSSRAIESVTIYFREEQSNA